MFMIRDDPLPYVALPLLSSLVVRDHYSVSSENQHLTLVLQKAETSSKKVWGHQMDQLFTFKMSEILRVLFTMRLLKTGPEVEKGFNYSEVRHASVYSIYIEWRSPFYAFCLHSMFSVSPFHFSVSPFQALILFFFAVCFTQLPVHPQGTGGAELLPS